MLVSCVLNMRYYSIPSACVGMCGSADWARGEELTQGQDKMDGKE